MTALSKVLVKPLKQIQLLFQPTDPSHALNVFDRLADLGRNSIMAACFTWTPHAPDLPEVVGSIARAILGGMSFALVLPFAEKIREELLGPAEENLFRLHRETTENGVLSFAEELSKQAPGVASRIRIFRPKETESGIVVPPAVNRYALVAEQPVAELTPPQKTLYVWVQTKDQDNLQEATPTADVLGSQPIKLWNAYFTEIFRCWEENGFDLRNAEFVSDYWRVVDSQRGNRKQTR
jgi:hypothetical protein